MLNILIFTFVAYLGFRHAKCRMTGRNYPGFLVRHAVPISAGFMFLVFLRAYVVSPYLVPSESMEPTFVPGDLLLVNKIAKSIEDVHTGEIVLVHDLEAGNYPFIKRVIGMPGDKVSYRDKQLTVNGQKLVQAIEPDTDGDVSLTETISTANAKSIEYRILNDRNKHRLDEGEWVVPEGHVFLMGDNRDESLDSRILGPFSLNNVVGKPTFHFAHFDSLGSLPTLIWQRIQ